MTTPLPDHLPDLTTTLERIRCGQVDAAGALEQNIAVAQSPRCAHVFLATMFESARAAAADPANRSRPLGGLAVSVKDLFDVRGQVSSAGSRVPSDRPPAAADCTAVARLRAAGGVVMARTNMVEFAFSGVGINPHFDTPSNAADAQVPRIPGGSSSGAAVSVASGAAFIGLGSDTGGSIRIPAALNGIVGFKSTARMVPADGTIPLSSTLDTVGALTRSVSDALRAHEILSASRVTRSAAPLAGYRLALVRNVFQDGLDDTVARAYQRTLDRLRSHGAVIQEVTLAELDELPGINASGGFSAAESYAWHRHLISRRVAEYDARVALRIMRGASMTAFEYIDLVHARHDWIERVTRRLAAFDAVLSPTVPIVAPPIAGLEPGTARDDAFFAVNAQLLRNTSIVNMLDGCAISIPCQAADELPVGLMVWQGALRDDTVLNVAFQIERLLQRS